jgi:hypothetical protein
VEPAARPRPQIPVGRQPRHSSGQAHGISRSGSRVLVCSALGSAVGLVSSFGDPLREVRVPRVTIPILRANTSLVFPSNYPPGGWRPVELSSGDGNSFAVRSPDVCWCVYTSGPEAQALCKSTLFLEIYSRDSPPAESRVLLERAPYMVYAYECSNPSFTTMREMREH